MEFIFQWEKAEDIQKYIYNMLMLIRSKKKNEINGRKGVGFIIIPKQLTFCHTLPYR